MEQNNLVTLVLGSEQADVHSFVEHAQEALKALVDDGLPLGW